MYEINVICVRSKLKKTFCLVFDCLFKQLNVKYNFMFIILASERRLITNRDKVTNPTIVRIDKKPT